MRTRGLRARLAEQFWVLPLVCAIAAVGLGIVLTGIDDSYDTSRRLPFLFAGGPEGARSLLAAIITSMISFTGLVFSITIVVLQLTSSQFSPRVLRSFLRDRSNQLTLGVFVATFVYGLVVLRSVRGTAQADPFVPQLAVTVAFGFVLASVAVFLGYIHHITQSIRAATIITNIWKETVKLLEHRYPGGAAPFSVAAHPEGPVHRMCADRSGVVQRIDEQQLQRLAEQRKVTIYVLRSVGAFVPAGAPLFDIYGDQVPDPGKLLGTVRLGAERSTEEDVGFGMRQLVDIAARALSPGVNDPTTAIQVIDQLHDLLRRLATRPLLPRQFLENRGQDAVHIPQPTFADYLDLAVGEIAIGGAATSVWNGDSRSCFTTSSRPSSHRSTTISCEPGRGTT